MNYKKIDSTITHKIEKIIEGDDGRVFTVSRGIIPPVNLPQQVIDDLVDQGMDREEAENIKTNGVSMRIMRAKHMETDVPVNDSTLDLIDNIKNKGTTKGEKSSKKKCRKSMEKSSKLARSKIPLKSMRMKRSNICFIRLAKSKRFLPKTYKH